MAENSLTNSLRVAALNAIPSNWLMWIDRLEHSFPIGFEMCKRWCEHRWAEYHTNANDSYDHGCKRIGNNYRMLLLNLSRRCHHRLLFSHLPSHISKYKLHQQFFFKYFKCPQRNPLLNYYRFISKNNFALKLLQFKGNLCGCSSPFQNRWTFA